MPTFRNQALSFLLSCFLCAPLLSQNLVPNGSFEEGVNCPSFIANLEEECSGWFFSITAEDGEQPTPDWFHTCSDIDLLAPPDVAFGYQVPANGDGYAGFVTYRVVQNPPNYREVLGVQLIEPLVVGNSYLVEFKISSLNTAGYYLVNDKIGFNFSTHPTYQISGFPINQSHFALDSILPFSMDWTEISAVFEADSAYNFLHIGNFYDDANTEVILESDLSQSGYYVVDDVRVTPYNLSTESAEESKPFVLSPNPVRNVLRLESELQNTEVEIKIYSVSGVLVYSSHVDNTSDNFEIDLRGLSPGSYILRLVTPKTTYNEVFIKN